MKNCADSIGLSDFLSKHNTQELYKEIYNELYIKGLSRIELQKPPLKYKLQRKNKRSDKA